MTKGMSLFRKRRSKKHTLCRRCGFMAYLLQKSTSGKYGYTAKHTRKYNWSARLKYHQHSSNEAPQNCIPQIQEGFCEGTPKPKKTVIAASYSS